MSTKIYFYEPFCILGKVSENTCLIGNFGNKFKYLIESCNSMPKDCRWGEKKIHLSQRADVCRYYLEELLKKDINFKI